MQRIKDKRKVTVEGNLLRWVKVTSTKGSGESFWINLNLVRSLVRDSANTETHAFFMDGNGLTFMETPEQVFDGTYKEHP